jgi:hypothetical protein
MATPVPYSGAPQVAPEDRPVPYTQLNVPGGAFGLGRAQATEQLGGAFQQAGGEIYARAVAMQELNQQAEANEAVAANERAQMSSFIDFKTNKMGKDAVDGLPGFMDGADATRQQIRGTLKSPYAQRLYDNESRNATNRIIFSAGIHASEQGKQYTIGASDARMGAANNSALSNPDDQAGFKAGLATIEQEAQQRGQIMGWSKEQTDNFIQQKKSDLAYSQVQGMAKSAPFTAKARLDQYVKDGLITGADAGKIADYVQRQQYTVGARKLSSDVMAGANSEFGTGIVSPERARDAVSAMESSGNYDPPHKTITNPNSQYYGQHALGKYGIMQGNLKPWLREAGMNADMSEQEFLRDHDAQDKLFDFKFGQYMQQTGSFNAARKLWFGSARSDGFTTQDKYQAVTDAALARSASRSDVDNVSRRAADKAIPGDNEFADIVSGASERQHSRDLQVRLDDQRRAASAVTAELLPDSDGRLKMSEDEFSPKVKSIFDAMPQDQQNKVRAALQNNVNKGGYAFTPQSHADYMNFLGLYNNPNRSPEDNDKLLNEDIGSKHWPSTEKKAALVMYNKLLDHEAADPQMAHPLQILDSLMSASDIDNKRDSQGHHKDEYNQFVGALTEAYKSYITDNGRKPKDDEVKAMGSRLVQDLTKYRRSIFQPVQKFYQMDVPQDTLDQTKEAYQRAYPGTNPTDVEIHSIAVGKMYQSLYGRKPQAAP